MSDALKPCPFCGKPPVVRNVMEEFGPEDGHPGGEFHAWAEIRCDVCAVEVSDEYRSQAVENWNTRAVEAELLAALKGMLRVCPRERKGMVLPEYDAARAAIAKAEGRP